MNITQLVTCVLIKKRKDAIYVLESILLSIILRENIAMQQVSISISMTILIRMMLLIKNKRIDWPA